MIGSSIEKVLKAADVISEVRKAFEKINNLETGQKAVAEALQAVESRVRELEASLREAKSDIKLAAVEAAQGTVNGAQGQIYQKMLDIEIRLARTSDHIDALRQQNAVLQIASSK